MRSQAFDDFDAFAQQVRDADFRMLLLNPERHIWAISQVNLGGIDIRYGHEGGGNITEGRSQSNGYLFFVPVTNANDHAANGSVLDSGSVVVLEPGIEFCLRSEVEHDWCSVFVPTSRLTRKGSPTKPRSESEKMACRVTRPTLPIADQFRAMVQQIMAADAQAASFDSTPAASCAAENLVRLVSLLLEQPAVEHNLQGRPAVPSAGDYTSVSGIGGATGQRPRTRRGTCDRG
jgi:hypothetical protein